jgi:hypothetical protein
MIISWQGREAGSQTFTDEQLDKVDVDEILEILDQGSG